MTYERLLAKSCSNLDEAPLGALLPDHLRLVVAAADSVIESTGSQQLQALGLDEQKFLNRLRRIVRLSAALHDLGKANDHFQEMVRRRPQIQGLRHEWVSFFILQEFGFEAWVQSALSIPLIDWPITLWAIAGHHPKPTISGPPREGEAGAGNTIRLLVDHADFVASIEYVQNTFELSRNRPICAEKTYSLLGAGIFSSIDNHGRKQIQIWDGLERDERKLAAAAKACLIAADVAGSALARVQKDDSKHANWVQNGFQAVPTFDELTDLIRDRIGEPDENLRDFQRKVADESTEVTLVKAGCGTGKTLAAYHWARRRWPNRRLYICYPTTGTATEGFRDYLVSGESPKFEAKLFHSRAMVDMDILGVREAEADEEAIKIESLAAWSTPIVCCTVDVVLGLIKNHRRGLFAWPALAGAAFVFDEIHSYDETLFGALLRWLESLTGTPTLLMTASLPTSRLEAIRECMAARNQRLAVIPGPKELEELPRYDRIEVDSDAELITVVRRELVAGGKVLWVCNTVDRAISVFESNRDLHPIVYHSRFVYKDRVDRHAAVVNAFKETGSAFAICTQVAEMSLDLSATLLVSDLSPVPASIQRLGRLNRGAKVGDPTRPFIIREPTDANGKLQPLPYAIEELEQTRRWLAMLPKTGVRQKDLSNAWEAMQKPRDSRERAGSSDWLYEGPWTAIGELRDPSPGITVIREQDVEAVGANLRQIARYALPMPSPRDRNIWKTWRRIGGLPVAPDEFLDYDEMRGARWRQ